MELLHQLLGQAGLPALLTTAELASLERVTPQTIRKNYCLKGHHHGLVPLKLPNGGLRWRGLEVQALLDGSAK
jgi:hypothetical protein